MKKEWRKLFDLPPAILWKQDILELIDILSEESEQQECQIEFQFDYDDCKQTLTTRDEINKFTQDHPTDKLSISMHVRAEEREKPSGVSITMHHSYISCQVHSDNEAWFLGKIQQLNKYFLKRKPWYSMIVRIMPFLTGAFLFFTPLVVITSLKTDNLFTAISMAILGVIIVVIGILSLYGKIFPYVKIYFRNKKRLFSLQLVMVIIAILSLIVTAIGSMVIPLLKE